MGNAGQMTQLHVGRREDDWRRADEWRRLHARPDSETTPAVESRRRPRIANILRLIPRHA
jgi:hypothetical protein